MSELPSGTLTFLFTDIEGSTRLLRQLRDRYGDVLADHRLLLRAAFAAYGGQEIGTEGDSFFIVFRRARDAVAAAADAQRALTEHTWPADAEIRVRMGMNTGEPNVDEDGSYVGLGVHLAARIASAGYGGQVLLSQATCALIQADEVADVSLEDLGEHQLKDFDRPERIFQLVIEDVPADFPPLKTLDAQAVEGTAREGALPYKGLEAFQPQDAEFFFGREELVDSLVGELAESRFLAVVGPSGSGKSSIVRAGLVPAIWRQAEEWDVVILTPGAEPLEELAVRLAAERGLPAGALLAELRSDPKNLCLATKQLLLDRPTAAKLVLVVDQFEEVFTLCRDDSERRCFISALVQAARTESARAVVILSLRADFYGHCASYPDLAALLQEHQAIVGPMREPELRRAIERPAAAAGLEVQEGLADAMLEDLGDEPGNLPLLSHALLETWKRRRGQVLTLADYRQAGGVREAIARTADAVYREQLDPDQQEIARRIFLRLTEPGRGTEDTRRRASLEEILPPGKEGAAAEAVLEVLARERLVTIGSGTVEVAHEALIREWPTLRRWLDEDREGLQIHRRLTEEAQEWRKLERDPGVLYRGARLQGALEWASVREGELNPLEREFLESSRAAADSELEAARRRNRRLRALAVTLGLLLLLALGAAAFAVRQTRQAQSERRLATSRGLLQSAAAQLPERLDLALLLGLEAERERSSPEARSGLLRAVQRGGRLVQFLRFHPDRVNDVVLSADGRTIASVSAESGIVLWDVAGKRPLGRHFQSATGAQPKLAVAFSPDGKLLASDAGPGAFALWDVASGRMLAVARASTLPNASVHDVAFSPDGRLLAAGSDDGLLLWDVARRRALGASLQRGSEPALEVAFAPGGKTVASSSIDGITLWDVSRRRPAGPLLEQRQAAAIAFSPDGRRLAAAGDQVVLWRLVPGPPAQQRLPVAGGASALAFSRDGRILAVARADHTIQLWDSAGQHALPLRLVGHSAPVTGLAFGAAGPTLVSASEDGTLALWNAAESVGARLLHGPGRGAPAVSFTPDGRSVVAASGSTAFLWPLAGRGSKARIDVGGEVLDLDVAPSGKLVELGTGNGLITTWELRSNRVDRRSLGDTQPLAVTLAPDGATLAVGTLSGRVSLAGRGGKAPPRVLRTAEEEPVYDLAFSPSGEQLAAARGGGTVDLYDGASGRSTGTLHGQLGDVRDVAFGPDGHLLAGAGGQPTVVLWDPESRRQSGEPLRGSLPLGSVAFSSDGRVIATGTSSGRIVLWDTKARIPLGEPLEGHGRAVLAVAFAPGGKLFASAGSDGRVLLHDVSFWLDDDALKKRACSMVGRNLTRSEWNAYVPNEEYRKTCPQWPSGS